MTFPDGEHSEDLMSKIDEYSDLVEKLRFGIPKIPKPVQPVQAIQHQKPWNCSVCTLKNAAAFNACEMCGTDAPPAEEAPRCSGSSPPISVAPLKEPWNSSHLEGHVRPSAH